MKPIKILGGYAAKGLCILILFGLVAIGRAQMPSMNDPYLDSWAFNDSTNWTSDMGYAPIAYTNIENVPSWVSSNTVPDCNALLLDSTNPAYLQYNVVETNGYTNFICSAGTIWFWFSPDWSSTNQGGTGPGDWGRFIDVGAWTSNASYGWWSLFVSPDGGNIYFSGQTNGMGTNYVSFPISWTNNSWHLIGLTYTATNSILYVDDQATNGLGVSYWPGPNVLTNGFYIGSDYSGMEQARGKFVDVEIYSDAGEWDSGFFSGYYVDGLSYLTNGDGSFGGGGGASPDFIASPALVASTNLWLMVTNMANGTAGLFLSNTFADIQYEIQSKTNLSATNWISEGFVLGSEITNWTPTSITTTNRRTLFLRVRSWADDGSGLPIWWQLQYFGYTGVDPNGNPAGDGWSNIQKFQNRWNPTNFYTPPAPQGLTATYNASTSIAHISWLPSPGAVTGYILTTPSGTNYLSASTNSYADYDPNLSTALTPSDVFDSESTAFELEASYSGGNSASASANLAPNYPNIRLVQGAQGSNFLAVSALPPGTVAIRLIREDEYAEIHYVDTSFNASNDIPISSFTNGFYYIPPGVTTAPVDAYGNAVYAWLAQTVSANGWATSRGVLLGENSTTNLNYGVDAINPLYFDGHVQLKQNLMFLLRVATATTPFTYTPVGAFTAVTMPTNYAYASYNSSSSFGISQNPLSPFNDNYIFANSVFNLTNLDSIGELSNNIYTFQTPAPGTTNLPALLGDSEWLVPANLDDSFRQIFNAFDDSDIAVTFTFVSNNGGEYDSGFYSMANGVDNLYGLKYSSVEATFGNSNVLLSASSGEIPSDQNTWQFFYPATTQPGFHTTEYDFWPLNFNITDQAIPGSPNFSTTNTSQLLIAGVGAPPLTVLGYAKMAVTNGYSGVYGYLGQYFDKAYQITNGVVTTNTTGILSSYGSFFATQPGPVALVTMPDPDTGARGTCTVYAVSLQLDANHDGNMDLSFSGADNTSASNPDQIWVNNNYDRWKYDLLGVTYEQDDTKIATSPDYNYTTSGFSTIPCPRDLEDYFRLWTPGLSTLMKALPSSYTVQLTLSGSGQIRVFQAVESGGSTNYLFDETTASNQVVNSASLYIGQLTSSSPVFLNIQTNFNEHFIFCGAANGNAQIDLQVLDENLNVIADAPAFLQINDIKQMYERWTVGDSPTNTPLSVAVKDASDLPTNPPVAAFQYSSPQNTNTPYILFVHGWNMQRWEKDRFAETAYKRLYWQGYQGRFGSFRWPTYADFPLGSWSWSAIDPRNFDKSESNAWASAIGLTNLLIQLNAEYSNHVYLVAHSMGNVVAGEALRKLGTPIVNTYEALQGAIAAHAYDTNTPIRDSSASTPDRYANYWTNGAPCYFSSSNGARTNVNFFNVNDWALTLLWTLDQDEKPDNNSPDFPGYYYSTPSGTHPSGFYKIVGSTDINFSFPGDTYTIFAFCDEASSYALGAQTNVGGIFSGHQVELDNPPYNFGPNHVDHSGEFRSDNALRGLFWNQVLVQMKLK